MNNHVECITDKYKSLTKGKIYKVDYEYSDCIIVTNDLDEKKKYPVDTFGKLTNNGGDSMNTNANKITPSYYGKEIDVIDFCQANNLDFMQGNVIKYVTRYKEKNGKEDLLKAIEYIKRIIRELDKQEKGDN